MKWFFIIIVLFSSSKAFPQQDKVSNSKTAQGFFIEGKIKELQFNYTSALENYQTALKYDKAPGIYYAIAKMYFETDRYQESFNSINKALQIDPKNISYKEHLANTYLALQKKEQAAQVYESILQQDSNYLYGVYTLARIYEDMSMPMKAILYYEKITERVGFDYDVLRRMYDIYYERKDYSKAIEIMENVLQLDPYETVNIKILALLYQRVGRNEDAQRVYEDLFRINPYDKELQAELVKVYFKNNETEKAFESFKTVLGKESLTYLEMLEIGQLYYNQITQDAASIKAAENIFTYLSTAYPNEWMPHYYLGALDIVNKNFDSYAPKFERALQLADTIRDAHIQIGFIYYQQNNLDAAQRVFEKALLSNTSDYQLNYLLGLVWQGKGDLNKAVSYYEAALSAQPDDLTVLSALGLIYDNLQQYDKSESVYEKALLIDPDNPLILNNYAYNLSERGVKLEKALKMAKRVIEKEPRNASYLDTIGWIYFKMGSLKEAEHYILQSLSLNAGSAVVTDHLADVYFAMNKKNEALRYWKKALELSPGSEEIKRKIQQNS